MTRLSRALLLLVGVGLATVFGTEPSTTTSGAVTTPSSTTDAVITVDNDGGKVKETQLWKIVSHKKKKRHFKHHGSHGKKKKVGGDYSDDEFKYEQHGVGKKDGVVYEYERDGHSHDAKHAAHRELGWHHKHHGYYPNNYYYSNKHHGYYRRALTAEPAESEHRELGWHHKHYGYYPNNNYYSNKHHGYHQKQHGYYRRALTAEPESEHRELGWHHGYYPSNYYHHPKKHYGYYKKQHGYYRRALTAEPEAPRELEVVAAKVVEGDKTLGGLKDRQHKKKWLRKRGRLHRRQRRQRKHTRKVHKSQRKFVRRQHRKRVHKTVVKKQRKNWQHRALSGSGQYYYHAKTPAGYYKHDYYYKPDYFHKKKFWHKKWYRRGLGLTDKADSQPLLEKGRLSISRNKNEEKSALQGKLQEVLHKREVNKEEADGKKDEEVKKEGEEKGDEKQTLQGKLQEVLQRREGNKEEADGKKDEEPKKEGEEKDQQRGIFLKPLLRGSN